MRFEKKSFAAMFIAAPGKKACPAGMIRAMMKVLLITQELVGD